MKNLKLKTKFYLLFLLLTPSVCLAQSKVEFEELVGGNIATQSITYAIKQDRIGNIWIASEEGVLKHNSKTYKIYNTYKGLPESVSNRAITIFIDAKQRVWVGMEKGLCLYNSDEDTFDLIGSNNKINPSLIDAITEDNDGNIWIGAFNGVWKYNSAEPATNTVTRIISNHSVQALVAHNGSLIFGTNKGVFSYTISTDKLVEINIPTSNKNISCISVFEEYALIGTKSGNIYRTDMNFSEVLPIKFEKKLSTPINDIIKDNKNNLYIATDGNGLFYTDLSFSILEHYTEDSNNLKSISSNGLYDIEMGKENILWIATYGGGINYFNSNKLPFQKIQHQINNPNSIATNFTRSIAEDQNGNLWFGTKQGISIWNTKTNTWKHISNLTKNKTNTKDIVLALREDGKNMWIGTYTSGLYKMNINTLKSIHYNTTFPKKDMLSKIYYIYKDSKSNIWVGGIQKDLKVIRPDNTVSTYPIQPIKFITESQTGEILITGKNGVYRLQDEEREFNLIQDLKPSISTLAYSTINALHETREGHLILATNGEGIVFYNINTHKLSKLSIKSGMPSDIIQGILVQDDTNFWASTTKGLAHIMIKQQDTIINVFDKNDGLASTEYNYGSFSKLNNNLIAFGGPEGITVFNPNNIKEQDDKPVVVFDGFKLFNKIISPGENPLKKHIDKTKSIVLNSNENSIEVSYTGVLHNSPSKVKYSWKLDGFIDEWSTPSSTNFATFTNLNPGNYTLRVKALNKYGDFGAERSLSINILSPWWATNKAFFLYFILALLIIYLIVYFTNAIAKKKHADEQIGFFNNITHEIKTPLTILLSTLDSATDGNPTNSESKKRIKTTVKRINSLFEQMLNFHKVTSQGHVVQHISEINLLNHFNKILNNFEPLTEERNIEIVINNYWGDTLFHYDIEILDKIVLNLISNAIKYSLENGKIVINLKKTSQGELKIDIEDNGLGIPKDQQKYILKRYYRARNVINSQRPGTGLGLIMVKKLIEKTGGSISFISEENKGTTFTVLLKDKKVNFQQNKTSKNEVINQQINEIDNHLELEEFSNSKILIVEDNDELRDILVNTLGVYFQIYEAKNGVEGLEMAHQIFPDIILTDLIMPEMDGMQMARKLKDDINLNHIPVFMLTVLQSSKQKLDSIESGISEYLEKPVNLKFLLAKMVNTLKWQQKLRKIYIHESDTDNATLYRNKHDQTFLENLENTILKNIENNAFSVHDLSKSVGMSRTSLYMKLKNLVDLSPQDFIIHAKLKHAKNLLIKGENSIKEIAYSSGFSNPKYFSTSFKKFYGITPSRFLESLQKK